MRFIYALIASTALSSVALADPNVPTVRPEDQNMRVQNYSPFVRTRLVGSIGRSTMITFAPAESIIRFVFGDDGATWHGPDPEKVKDTPLNNIAYMYPRKPGYTTLQIVTATPGKPDRVYQFAIEARELPTECKEKPVNCDDPAVTYGLSFRYPQDEVETKEAERRAHQERWRADAPVRAARRERVQNIAMRERLEVDFFNGGGYRNWRYEAQANESGRRFLVPDAVTDNGQETAFRFIGNRSVPAFFVMSADGKEQSIQPTMRGDIAVLPQVAQEWHLRLGDAVIYVFNRAYSASGYAPMTGTTSPDVVRTLRQARAE